MRLAPLALLFLVACGSVLDTRSQAQRYARAEIACAVDADCCVAFDTCLTEGLVVSSQDRGTVTDLLAKASREKCTACILPAIQVRCETGRCIGGYIEPSGACDINGLQPYMKDHCGVITLPTGCAEIAPKGQALRIGCSGEGE